MFASQRLVPNSHTRNTMYSTKFRIHMSCCLSCRRRRRSAVFAFACRIYSTTSARCHRPNTLAHTHASKHIMSVWVVRHIIIVACVSCVLCMLSFEFPTAYASYSHPDRKPNHPLTEWLEQHTNKHTQAHIVYIHICIRTSNVFKHTNGGSHTCYDRKQAEHDGEQRRGTVFLRYAGHHFGDSV